MMNRVENIVGLSVEEPSVMAFWNLGEKDPSPLLVEGEFLMSQEHRGVSITISEELKISCISLSSGKQKGANKQFKKYRGVLPLNLKFGMTKSQVNKLLGEPLEEKTEYESFLGVDINPWIHYKMKNFDVTLELDKNGKKVIGVSLMQKEKCNRQTRSATS